MSIDTPSQSGHDPSAELPGVHDRLRRAFEAASEERWDDYVEILQGATSEGLKRKAELAKGGDGDE